jgi:hypothetical protein
MIVITGDNPNFFAYSSYYLYEGNIVRAYTGVLVSDEAGF